MAKGKYTISDRQGERMVNAMRRRGEEAFSRMTRRSKPLRPEDVRTTHTTMTKVNKNKEDR
jgi:hypothetical protein